jgi:hypothetical protein
MPRYRIYDEDGTDAGQGELRRVDPAGRRGLDARPHQGQGARGAALRGGRGAIRRGAKSAGALTGGCHHTRDDGRTPSE